MLLDKVKGMTAVIVTGAEHAERIAVIIEQKVESEAKAVANAVTPEVEAAIDDMNDKLKALTDRLAATRQAHEAASPPADAPSSSSGTAAAEDHASPQPVI